LLNKVEECSNEIPQETRLIIAALDNPIRQAILVLLSEKKELSFSEIQKTFSMEKLTLNFHLKKLFSSALIDHYYKHEIGNQKYSFYSVTPLGNRILNSLNGALIPPAEHQQ
jgi:DNA-binding transcriptional ArsR family regulator